MKKLLMYITVLLLMIGCGANPGSEEETKKNNEETVSFAIHVDLFNSIEKMVKQVTDKKYSDAYDTIKEVYELTNKAGIVYDDNSDGANNYLDTLNALSKQIYEQSNNEKLYKIAFDYEKSMLQLFSETKSDGQDGGSSNSSSSNNNSDGGSSESNSGGSESNGGSSNEETDTEQADLSQEEDQIVIPEEKILTQYPELAISQSDLIIKNQSIDLMNYISNATILKNPENEVAIINRQKYLFYKLVSVGQLSQYGSVDILIDEAEKNWENLYLNLPEDSSKDILTINATINNISTALNKRNPVAVEIQSKAAIKTLETLSNQTKSKEEE